MAHMYNRVVSVITKQYNQRTDEDLLPLLPWFAKKTKLFETMKQDILLDILRHCDFSIRNQDDVIIRQGDRGDCFYIILSGKVSIFINTEGLPELTEELNAEIAKKEEKLDRTKFGRFIAPLDAGKAFGELALINKDCVRNASIIADEKTDLVVIDRELYNRSLKAAQEADLKRRQDFVNSCPLFENWQLKYKKQVGMSLRCESLPFDAPIVKQGCAVDGLHFIIKGQAKVIVDTGMHELQYPVILMETDPDLADRFAAIEEIIGASPGKKSQHYHSEEVDERNLRRGKSSASRRPPSVMSAKSKRVFEVSLIGANEIIGDVEQALGVATYMHSVVCTQPTEIFILDSKNFERLVMGKNVDTVHMLQEMARVRLQSKLLRSLDKSIPLLRCFMFRLQTIRKSVDTTPDTPVSPDLLPTRPQMKSQLTCEKFIPHRGPVIDFYGPGTVYYRNKLRKGRRKPLALSQPTSVLPESVLRPDTGPYLPLTSTRSVESDKKSLADDFESSNEHLQQLEQRIREWYCSIKLPKTPAPPRSALATASTNVSEELFGSARSDACPLHATRLRRIEPEQLADIKPGFKVRLHKKKQRDLDADLSSDDDSSIDDALSIRTLSVKTSATAHSTSISLKSPRPTSDKKPTMTDYKELRMLLKQKEREFVHRRAPVL